MEPKEQMAREAIAKLTPDERRVLTKHLTSPWYVSLLHHVGLKRLAWYLDGYK